ncbi:hypothetical protein H5410_020151 [Solanum commersonii]|uniref:Uncharacterized protein n=1 Tax=Solanum commersonii TaxID=4109 RepID=A0A9J5ZDB7_SOLCO|nr:hypothetical protein H5410_020151 [Solanum commersonii]
MPILVYQAIDWFQEMTREICSSSKKPTGECEFRASLNCQYELTYCIGAKFIQALKFDRLGRIDPFFLWPENG